MGRLIDADALIEQLRAEGRLTFLIKGAIDNQPTAYDVEKVVSELDKIRNCTYEYGMMLDFDDAIEIVRAVSN